MSEFKATHTTADGTPVMIAVSHPLDPTLTIVVDEDGSPEMWGRADLTPIPAKPEPPAEMFIDLIDTDGIWAFVGWASTPPGYRYVLAPEGSKVLDRDMAQVFDDWLHAEPEPWETLTEATFDFRGGA